MTPNDDFFKGPASNELTQKILKKAQGELAFNRQHKKSKIWFLIIGPVMASLAASFFIFKINISQNIKSAPQANFDLAAIEEVLSTSEHFDLVSDLPDDLETVEMVGELSFLQEFDEIELITDEELEG